jgi:hypothetical protein
MITVKCLSPGQMHYIMANHHKKTSQQMAKDLNVDDYKVNLFCQANAIEALNGGIRKSRKNCYHIIPQSQKLKMKRKKYQGPKKS